MAPPATISPPVHVETGPEPGAVDVLPIAPFKIQFSSSSQAAQHDKRTKEYKFLSASALNSHLSLSSITVTALIFPSLCYESQLCNAINLPVHNLQFTAAFTNSKLCKKIARGMFSGDLL